MTNNPQNRDQEVTTFATAELMALPALVRDAELLMQDLAQSVRETKRLLAEAEVDAQINATADGKNAEQRKLQLEAAVFNNASVQALRATLSAQEQQAVTAEVDYSGLHRRWKTALALAELQTAKITYLATFKK